MSSPRPVFVTALLALVCLSGASRAHAQVDDHFICYKTKDPLALKGVVNLTSPQFGNLAGCKVGKAKVFCVYASKTAVTAFNKKTLIDPLPIDGAAQTDDRVCYKLKCDSPEAMQLVSDQFGSRTIARGKTALLCTPAIKGPPPTTTTTTSTTVTTTSTVTTTTLGNPGDPCSLDNQCQSSNCQCANAACNARICATVSCNVSCQFALAGGTSCGNIAVGTDPRDACAQACNGNGSCQSCGPCADTGVGNLCFNDGSNNCGGGFTPVCPSSIDCSTVTCICN